MSKNIRDWLKVSNEEASEAPVIVQDGATPTEDFSAASNAESSTVETAAPAVVELQAASADAPEQEVIDQGHQEVRISAEESSEEAEVTIPAAAPTDEAPAAATTVEETATVVIVETEAPAELQEDTPVVETEIEATVSAEEGGDVEAVIEAAVAADVVQVPTDEVVIVEQPLVVEPVAVTEVAEPAVEETVETEIVVDEETPIVVADQPIEPEEAAAYAADVSDEPEIIIASEQFGEINNDISELTNIQYALEGYGKIIADGMASGEGISPETATAIRIGMECIDPFFSEEGLVPSAESFENTSRLAATTMSLEGYAESLKKVIEATQNALRKLFDILYDLWVKTTGGAGRALQRAGELKERVKALRVDRVKNAEREISGAARLSVNGNFVGLDKKAIADIAVTADYMYRQYPDQVKSLANDILKTYEDAFKSIDGTEEDLETFRQVIYKFARSVKSNVKAIPGAQPVASSHLPASLQKYAHVHAGKSLPGDYALVQYLNTDVASLGIPENVRGAGELVAVYGRFDKLFNVQFVKLTSTAPAPEKATYKVPSKKELGDLLDELEGLLKQVVAGGNKRTIYGDIQKEMKSTIDQTSLKLMKALMGKDQHKVIGYAGFITNLQSLASMLTQPGGQFNGYVVGTCNAFMGLLSHCLSVLEAEVVDA